MTPACSSISLFPSAQTKNTRDGPTAAFPKDSILSRMGKPRIQPTISFVISFIPAWAGKLDAAHRQLGGDGPIPTHAGKTHSHSLPPITTLAHPRSRGENNPACSTWYPSLGSSPLTRGKPRSTLSASRAQRLIPAHAGKTSWGVTRIVRASAHPRSRGENQDSSHVTMSRWGSSPLTRGKHRDPRLVRVGGRLIPAHAGKTVCDRPREHNGPAHPRSRGENCPSSRARSTLRGSSPLTRGKHDGPHRSIRRIRLIPAHAGKTPDADTPPPDATAHPRSRGENSGRPCRLRAIAGSSPLTRGKPTSPGTTPPPPRLIPAHAGKTRFQLTLPEKASAHPRSRGENSRCFTALIEAIGSSPLTRGKLFSRVTGRPPRRLIPAHAGKTSAASACLLRTGAHPRSRGENEVNRRFSPG